MNNLRNVRSQMNYTQKQIADFLDMEQTHYSRYEREGQKMGIERYKQLAVFYNVSIDYLCGLTDQPRTLTGIS